MTNEEQTLENNDRQIVLYNPPSTLNDKDIDIDININTNICRDIVPVQVSNVVTDPDPNLCYIPPLVLPSVGAYTVQCAMCYKWRLIPSKEKYQEIREHILEKPFTCGVAREWRSEVSCDDPGDVEQDGSMLWAIDKASIAQPPPGWDRELRIRSPGCCNFADVYYTSPKGKKLRSGVEVQKYLEKHPEFIEQGVTLSQFSFTKPKPLQKDYVRKKPYISKASSGEPGKVTRPVKKKTRPSTKHILNNDALLDNQPPQLFITDTMHNDEVHNYNEGLFPPPEDLHDP